MCQVQSWFLEQWDIDCQQTKGVICPPQLWQARNHGPDMELPTHIYTCRWSSPMCLVNTDVICSNKSAGLKSHDRIVRIQCLADLWHSFIQALVGSGLAITASLCHYVTAISGVKFLSRFSVSLACVVSEQTDFWLKF